MHLFIVKSYTVVGLLNSIVCSVVIPRLSNRLREFSKASIFKRTLGNVFSSWLFILKIDWRTDVLCIWCQSASAQSSIPVRICLSYIDHETKPDLRIHEALGHSRVCMCEMRSLLFSMVEEVRGLFIVCCHFAAKSFYSFFCETQTKLRSAQERLY